MPTKPTREQLKKRQDILNNEKYGIDAFRCICNEVPEVKNYLIAKGLVKEIKDE